MKGCERLWKVKERQWKGQGQAVEKPRKGREQAYGKAVKGQGKAMKGSENVKERQ